MRRVLLLAALCSITCAGQNNEAKFASEAPEPLPLSAPKEFLSGCTVACARSRQMQAISAQAIDAQCEDLCHVEWTYPALFELPQVASLDGQRARVVGVLAATSQPPSVKLEDGGRVLLQGGPGMSDVSRLNGQRVIAVGTVARGITPLAPVGIEHVTTIAPVPSS